MKKFILIKTLGLMPGMAMPREPLSLGAALGLGAGNALLNIGGSFLSSGFNRDAAQEALDRQVNATKALYAWQQKHYLSPKAQLENVAEAGLMPSSLFGNHSPINVGGQMVSPTAPSYGLDVGTQSLGEVAQLLVGAAQAKKAGVEIPNIEEDTRSKVLGNERQEFENMLLQKYGLQKSAAELALAEQNVKLAMAQTDVSVQEKAVKEWTAAKEKAMSEVNEVNRAILQKELDNKDIELNIRNRQGEANIGLTKSQSNAANASAVASMASARELNASAEGKELLNNISRATNLTDIDNAIFNSGTLQLMQQSNDKEKLYQDLVRNIKISSAYKNSDNKQKVDAALQNFGQMLGIPIAVIASMVKGVK